MAPQHRTVRSASARSRRAPLIVALVALAWVAAACGGGSSSDGDAAGEDELDVEVRPFEEVQGSDLTFQADPGDPGRAIFRVTTSEPMICALVWGETPSFGRFNNSITMEGTGIEQHDVVLPDVEAGTTYHYVVQGTTADGTLYRSEPATFVVGEAGDPSTSPGPGSVADDPREDLAEGATVVDVSSEHSEAFAAELALDGDPATEWSTRGDGDDAYLVIDLGEPQVLGSVELITRSMADGSAITETYTVIADGGEVFGPFPAGSPGDPRPSPLDVTAQQLRFDVERSTGGNVGAVAIRVFGPG